MQSPRVFKHIYVQFFIDSFAVNQQLRSVLWKYWRGFFCLFAWVFFLDIIFQPMNWNILIFLQIFLETLDHCLERGAEFLQDSEKRSISYLVRGLYFLWHKGSSAKMKSCVAMRKEKLKNEKFQSRIKTDSTRKSMWSFFDCLFSSIFFSSFRILCRWEIKFTLNWFGDLRGFP